MAGEPTTALRFTGVQRAASVGAPPAIPATVYSFVHRAILWVDGTGSGASSSGVLRGGSH